jgi:protein-tyrosine-phosphatase
MASHASRNLGACLSDSSRILFLCSGNMVRSAFAEGYAVGRLCPLPVSSAATVYRNGRILVETELALRQRGVSEEWLSAFRPTYLGDVLDDLDPNTLVLAMARMHCEPLRAHRSLARRTFLLENLLGSEADILDPVMDGAEFNPTFERIARCVDVLIERLRRGESSGAT